MLLLVLWCLVRLVVVLLLLLLCGVVEIDAPRMMLPLQQVLRLE